MGELSYRAQMPSDDILSLWAGGSQGSAKLLDSRSLFIFQSHDVTFNTEVSKGWLFRGLKSARDKTSGPAASQPLHITGILVNIFADRASSAEICC